MIQHEANIFLHATIRLVFVKKMQCVHCDVRNEFLCIPFKWII